MAGDDGKLVALTTIGLGWSTIQDVMAPPIRRPGVTELIDLFSMCLLVLVGVELVGTVKTYEVGRSRHAAAIGSVCLVAITRKQLLLEPKTLDGLSLIAIAPISATIARAYRALRRLGSRHPA